jgi:hypothetical protein
MKGDLGVVDPWDFFLNSVKQTSDRIYTLFSVPHTVLILGLNDALSALRIKTD